jgi:hypothetical protein
MSKVPAFCKKKFPCPCDFFRDCVLMGKAYEAAHTIYLYSYVIYI